MNEKRTPDLDEMRRAAEGADGMGLDQIEAVCLEIRNSPDFPSAELYGRFHHLADVDGILAIVAGFRSETARADCAEAEARSLREGNAALREACAKIAPYAKILPGGTYTLNIGGKGEWTRQRPALAEHICRAAALVAGKEEAGRG